jgi:DNA-binding transcriptional LysR family regulator
LRAREIDFAVAETSTLNEEHDVDVESLATHAVYFVARAGHPLAKREWAGSASCFTFPFVAMGRYPPRAMEPMLASRPGEADSRRPFPAIEAGTLAAVKRVIAKSDGIAALSLSCVADELHDGALTLLGTESWMRLNYGLVSLKGRPLNTAAQALREYIRKAEAALLLEESALFSRYVPRKLPPPRLVR